LPGSACGSFPGPSAANGRLDPGVSLLAKPYRESDLARKIRELLD
jgi:hypothetical protein